MSLCLEVYHKQHSEASTKSTITVLWAASKLLQTRVEIGGSREGSPQADADTASGASFHGPGKAWVKFYRPLLQVMIKEGCGGGRPRHSIQTATQTSVQ